MARKNLDGFSTIHIFVAFLAGFAIAAIFSHADRHGGNHDDNSASDLLRFSSSSGKGNEQLASNDGRALSNDAALTGGDGQAAISEAATAILKEVEAQLASKAADQTLQRTIVEPAVPAISTSSTSTERNFFEIAKKSLTDKVQGLITLPECLEHPEKCTRKGCKREECRAWGHFYHTMYQDKLGKYSTDDAEPFQFLEIGYFEGRGFDAYTEFLPKGELHSMEISCLPEGPREEGKWPWGNFAKKNPRFQQFVDKERLHCGDASDLKWLDQIWKTKMQRDDAPPLKIVVDDAAHLSKHMAISMFYWFPRIAPGGVFVMEDIQPIRAANKFRTQFLPQMMNDLHFCGDPNENEDNPCFPQLQPFLAGIHCEMHICIFTRNDKPAIEPSLEESTAPEGALDLKTCKALDESWGTTGDN